MKLKYDFAVREVAGEYVLVPMGESALAFSGLAFCNEVGAFLVQQLREEKSEQQLIEAVTENYEVDRAVAEADVKEFISRLQTINVLA